MGVVKYEPKPRKLKLFPFWCPLSAPIVERERIVVWKSEEVLGRPAEWPKTPLTAISPNDKNKTPYTRENLVSTRNNRVPNYRVLEYLTHKNEDYRLGFNDDIKQWCIENLKGNYRFIAGEARNRFVYFDNASDAVLFKMRWT